MGNWRGVGLVFRGFREKISACWADFLYNASCSVLVAQPAIQPIDKISGVGNALYTVFVRTLYRIHRRG